MSKYTFFLFVSFKAVKMDACLLFEFFTSSLKIPEIYWQFSTKRVLTMEFCDGGKVDDHPYMKSHKISSDEASSSFFLSGSFS